MAKKVAKKAGKDTKAKKAVAAKASKKKAPKPAKAKPAKKVIAKKPVKKAKPVAAKKPKAVKKVEKKTVKKEVKKIVKKAAVKKPEPKKVPVKKVVEKKAPVKAEKKVAKVQVKVAKPVAEKKPEKVKKEKKEKKQAEPKVAKPKISVATPDPHAAITINTAAHDSPLPRFNAPAGKVNKVISYHNLTPELMDILNKKYPDGYMNHVFKVNLSPENFFYAVTLDLPDIHYLVKVQVKIDTNPEEEFEDKEYASEDFAGGAGGEEETIEGGDEIEATPDTDE